MPATVTDPAALRETILRVLGEGPATWIQIQARAGGNLDIVAAGLVLRDLEEEGLVLHARMERNVYRAMC